MTENFYISLIFCTCICVCFLIDHLFKRRDKNKFQKKANQFLRKLEDVKANEVIIATVTFSTKNGEVIKNTPITVLNNNPFDKKMFVRISFINEKTYEEDYEDRVLSYDSDFFKHFTTLNSLNNRSDIVGLFKSELDLALIKEEYEIASVMRDAISKIEKIKSSKNVEG